MDLSLIARTIKENADLVGNAFKSIIKRLY